jgi:hypothetical protein
MSAIVTEENGRRETGTYGFGGRKLYDDLFEPKPRGTTRLTRRWHNH